MADNDGTMIKLNSNNYSLWKTLMEDMLCCKDLYDPIEHKGVMPAGKQEAEWKKLDRKACGMIRRYVDISVIHHVAQETKAYSLWKKLEGMFERKTAQNKAFLIRKLMNLKYQEGKNAAEHLNRFQEICNQLTTVKIKLEDEVQALILLGSLPDSWETLVVSLSNSTKEEEMSLALVKDSILTEEARRKEQGVASSESEVLVTEHRGRNKYKNPRGYNDGESRDEHKGRSNSRKEVICYYCENPGHIQKECRKWKRDQAQGKAKDNTAAVAYDGELLVLCDNDFFNAVNCESVSELRHKRIYHPSEKKQILPSVTVFEEHEDYGGVADEPVDNPAVSRDPGSGEPPQLSRTGEIVGLALLSWAAQPNTCCFGSMFIRKEKENRNGGSLGGIEATRL